ncbi:uncharacterized protein [Onthophagus taurus]|uniref:uncharacterized protein n=1 Tax=Onthophagus taurus TaxID=166361 RepID=UPI0039BE8B11
MRLVTCWISFPREGIEMSNSVSPQNFLYFSKELIYFNRLLIFPMVAEELKLRSPLIIWITVCLTALLLFTDVFQSFKYNLQLLQPKFIDNDENQMENKNTKQFLVTTEKCNIPEMDPYDISVRGFIFDEKPVRCDNGRPPLFESNRTSIYIEEKSLRFYGILDRRKLTCKYTPFKRVDPENGVKDNKVVFGSSVNFSDQTNVNDEFVMVECFYKSLSIYKDFFAFVPLKNNDTKIDQNEFNVLVIGLDSVSRLNFHRQMPKTKSILEKIKAVELLGYNKVGDNTFPNLIPLLTGLSEEDLQKTCWKNASLHFDDCPFIWKLFKEKHYTTAFGEDASWMGTFNYQKMGFLKQPTDYFWCPFNMVAEKHIGGSHRMNVQQCVGSREVYKTLLEYATKFITQMNHFKQKYFGFFWQNSLSHDFLNKLKLGDTFYANFLTNLIKNDTLKNTILLFLSDHGMRWGAIRTTYQGRIEERLPLIYIYLPENFKESNPISYSNLIRNKRRLSTPFDIHQTLLELIQHPEKHSNFSYSLFKPIPENRTCENASISSHWCTCHESTKLPLNDATVTEVALHTVDYINRLLKGTECWKLNLAEITDARKFNFNKFNQTKFVQKNYYFEDISIVIKTEPGDGLFESTVRKRYQKKIGNKTKYTLETVGSISRLNLYGGQSVCITDYHLKLYCYCR